MGGIGSGEYEREDSRKLCVEQCFSIDSFNLARQLAERPSTKLCLDFSYEGRDRFSVLVSALKHKRYRAYSIWAMIIDQGINQHDAWTTLHPPYVTKESCGEIFAGADELWAQGQPFSLGFAEIFNRQTVNIEVTMNPTGSYCSWFHCSSVNQGGVCSRRCRKLYWRNGRFACRVCHDLAYSSQYKDMSDRLFDKAEKIRWQILRKLDEDERKIWQDDNLCFPPPPPRMSYARYDALHHAWRTYSEKSVRTMVDNLVRQADNLLQK